MAPARALIWLLALAAAPAAAQSIVTSPGPDRVEVTLYRDPGRDPSQAPDLQWLDGYALISETRRVSVPAGESDIRFEGVASGILPQSAIVEGFPDGVVERNRDAYLLSPGTLLERSLGRRVHLRRTSLATGEVREQEALIRSSADGAVVLQTREGFEALRCSGLAETIVYDSVPPGLSARPTLSVRVRSLAPVETVVTLSYLAEGFDWEADYVATFSEEGDSAELLAWMTLASNDETSFVGATAQAVAGALSRAHADVEPPEAPALTLRCWPQSSTSDIPEIEVVVTGRRVAAASPVTVVNSQEVRLTGTTRVGDLIAAQEALGDVKLYRIPEPVTIAANSQKQVAFLRRERVRLPTVYRQTIDPADAVRAYPAQRVLVTRNRPSEGLGIPLPAGRLVLFAAAGDRRILIGEGSLRDRAVGEEVEIPVGEAPGVRTEVELLRKRGNRSDYVVTVTNDLARPVPFEGTFSENADRRIRPAVRLPRRDGRPLWAVTVPANGTASLRFRVVEREE